MICVRITCPCSSGYIHYLRYDNDLLLEYEPVVLYDLCITIISFFNNKTAQFITMQQLELIMFHICITIIISISC